MIEKRHHNPTVSEKTGGSSREDGNINSEEKDFLEEAQKKRESVSYDEAKRLLKNYRN